MSKESHSAKITKISLPAESKNGQVPETLFNEAKKFQLQEDLNRANATPTYRITSLSAMKIGSTPPLKLELKPNLDPPTPLQNAKDFKFSKNEPKE
jgi:hypothetical protein